MVRDFQNDLALFNPRGWTSLWRGAVVGALIASSFPTAGLAEDIDPEKSGANSGSVILRVGADEDDPPSLILAGATTGAPGQASFLRFVNTGRHAGSARVTLLNAATGGVVADWTSPPVPPLGSLEVPVTNIAGAAAPPSRLSAAQVLDLKISADFTGNVQHVGSINGALVNLTVCGAMTRAVGRVLGTVAGPGQLAVVDFVRVVNSGRQAGRVTLTLHDGSTGVRLATWTSPEIPAHASLNAPAARIAAEASPAVDRAVATLTLSADRLAPELRLEHLSNSKSKDGVANLSTVCRLQNDSDAPFNDTSQ